MSLIMADFLVWLIPCAIIKSFCNMLESMLLVRSDVGIAKHQVLYKKTVGRGKSKNVGCILQLFPQSNTPENQGS